MIQISHLAAMAFVGLACFGGNEASHASATDRPNVVVMLADNMGFGDLGAYGSGGEIRGMPTPRIDGLASEGLMLTQFFVEPGCTPSRAALMTGRYSPRAGLGSIIVAGTPSTLQAEEHTLAEMFKSKGYTTGMAGKWHLGARSVHNLPANRGFDYHFGFLGGGEDHNTQRSYEGEQYVDLWKATAGAAGPAYNGPAYGENGTYSCELYGGKAVRAPPCAPAAHDNFSIPCRPPSFWFTELLAGC